MEQTVDRISLIKNMKLMSIMGKRFVYDPATTFCAEIDESAYGVLSKYKRIIKDYEPDAAAAML